MVKHTPSQKKKFLVTVSLLRKIRMVQTFEHNIPRSLKLNIMLLLFYEVDSFTYFVAKETGS